jgi:hypothetical protein
MNILSVTQAARLFPSGRGWFLCQSYQEHGCFVAKVGIELLVPEACGRRVK